MFSVLNQHIILIKHFYGFTNICKSICLLFVLNQHIIVMKLFGFSLTFVNPCYIKYSCHTWDQFTGTNPFVWGVYCQLSLVLWKLINTIRPFLWERLLAVIPSCVTFDKYPSSPYFDPWVVRVYGIDMLWCNLYNLLVNQRFMSVYQIESTGRDIGEEGTY